MQYDHWIGGRMVPPLSGAYIPVFDPRTSGVSDEVARGSLADVDRAAQDGASAQIGWSSCSAADRASVLLRIAEAIEAEVRAFVDLERSCTGKVDGQLRHEVLASAAYFRYYAGVLRSLHGRTIDQGSANHTYTRLEPYGLVAVITPWNLPLNQACRATAPAIAVGNAVLVKPSEYTSTSTLHLARVAGEAELPPGVVNVVTGTGDEVGQPLIAHPAVRKVAFTGSVSSGRRVAAVAAERLVPLTLELGGKSPLVIFADADLDRAAAAAVSALATNAGQVCSATTRLLVENSVHDEVVARVVQGIQDLEPDVDFGPMITEGQYGKVMECFDEAREAGLDPVIGGGGYETGPAAAGWYVRPTLYTGVTDGMRIAREEIFGPVMVAMSFCDEAEAVALSNGTDYGLVASVWCGDLARGLRMAERIAAGQVSVNGGPLSIDTPFGGYKLSGYGREKGLEALHEYAAGQGDQRIARLTPDAVVRRCLRPDAGPP